MGRKLRLKLRRERDYSKVAAKCPSCGAELDTSRLERMEYVVAFRPKAKKVFELATTCPECKTKIDPTELELTITLKPKALMNNPEVVAKYLQKLGELGRKIEKARRKRGGE